MEANQETDNETLMNCIRNCRASYDKSSTDYKVPLTNIMLGRRFQKSWALRKMKSKTRYSNIRTNFSKYIKKRRSSTSRSGRCDMPLIRDEFEHQRWLLPHSKHVKVLAI